MVPIKSEFNIANYNTEQFLFIEWFKSKYITWGCIVMTLALHMPQLWPAMPCSVGIASRTYDAMETMRLSNKGTHMAHGPDHDVVRLSRRSGADRMASGPFGRAGRWAGRVSCRAPPAMSLACQRCRCIGDGERDARPDPPSPLKSRGHWSARSDRRSPEKCCQTLKKSCGQIGMNAIRKQKKGIM